jgi:prephenate dehydratase
VADSQNNETRFFVVKKGKENTQKEGELNASLVVFSKEDRPGLLYDILSKFHDEDINLNSILSRPSNEDLGKYNFYMECSLVGDEVKKLYHLVSKLKEEKFVIEILGVYNALE